jgi:hypothetical protein
MASWGGMAGKGSASSGLKGTHIPPTARRRMRRLVPQASKTQCLSKGAAYTCTLPYLPKGFMLQVTAVLYGNQVTYTICIQTSLTSSVVGYLTTPSMTRLQNLKSQCDWWIIESNSVITSYKGLNILCRYKRVLLHLSRMILWLTGRN